MEPGYFRDRKLDKLISSDSKRPLEGYLLCLDGFSDEEEARLVQLSQSLGAQVTNMCSQRVAFIVVKRIGSRLFSQALLHSIPAVSSKYLKEVQKSAKLLPLDTFILPPFYKLSICCTGLNLETRELLKEKVRTLGGNFMADLVRDQTTHLVADKPSGSKYEYAKAWGNIKVVSLNWVSSCYRSKKWLSEDDYTIKEDVPKEQNELPTALILNTDFDFDEVEKVPMTSKAVQGKEEDASEEQKDQIDGELQANKVAVKRKSPASALEQAESHIISHIDVAQFPSPALILAKVLHKKEIFVTGYSSEVQEYLFKCILHAHGHVTKTLDYETSFVALGPQTSPIVRRVVSQHPNNVQYINLVWIFEHLFQQEDWIPFLDDWVPA